MMKTGSTRVASVFITEFPRMEDAFFSEDKTFFYQWVLSLILKKYSCRKLFAKKYALFHIYKVFMFI